MKITTRFKIFGDFKFIPKQKRFHRTLGPFKKPKQVSKQKNRMKMYENNNAFQDFRRF